ncbi:TRAP-type mannitol/chloroaromatic compound transport system, small permease component [Tistlia consotensis]|uniref:TRAP transporter small permease protein n=1 Tax=Tistlia consotensis USBA 355 TaxID=560819 RepID=A0A1Y6C833_9PROT|nr:TRAP transporter small permease subunit [Tistlia consotensis]SMF48662.1 TRAP-type mannitol/chloroaromatic compound transport system, small permease component [Tistlia consotensis USBA 355]SNR80925.1 TRAP-type mannitol/chloroaromatic compound transport system, small permease component [Tistlia consotensis]
MSVLLAFAGLIDRLTKACGLAAMWLVPLVVLVAAAVMVLRYLFLVGYPWLSESYVWLNGVIFMVSAAYVLQIEGHVRVDVLYRKFGTRARALVNVLGVLLLLWPAMYVIGTDSIPIVERSWRTHEASPTPDGLPVMYLFKTFILVFCALLVLQGLSLLLKSLASLVDPDRWGHLMERRSEGGQDQAHA